ncbi:MAG: glycosyltransferase [Streptosporangiales bacterium]|nr:glycosyltransferase [Streptosporangiales bacterium]
MSEPSAEALPLVLVTVGTDHHAFARLVGWADRWAADRGHVRVLVQHGASIAPSHAAGRAFLDHGELQEAMASAVAVVTHGGPATITEARRTGHLPIVVPRDPGLGEHVDDHQQRFVTRLAAAGLVRACASEEELRELLDDALKAPERHRIGTPEAAAEGQAPVPAAVRRAGELIDTLVAARRGPVEAAVVEDDAGEPADGDWPSVTVVIPTRDRPELLRATLEAIRAQDYPGPVECLVVYDQSDPDHTLEDAGPERQVRVIVNERSAGLAGARNTGVLATTAPYVAFCDDDDLWLRGKLRAQVRTLLADPSAELVCCGIRVAYDGTEVDRPLALTQVSLNDLLRSRLTELHPSTFVMRRDALVDGFGLVSEEIPGSYGEDYEFLLRAARRGGVRNVPEVGVRVLWHRRSYFTSRWETISTALTWLLDRYPEFRLEPRGHARVAGQIAFAEAARGRRAAALRWAWRTVRSHPAEARAHLALAVACGLPADAILRQLHKRGRGI